MFRFQTPLGVLEVDTVDEVNALIESTAAPATRPGKGKATAKVKATTAKSKVKGKGRHAESWKVAAKVAKVLNRTDKAKVRSEIAQGKHASLV